VKRVILCSGKHFYTLDNYRRNNNIADTAIIRLEVTMYNMCSCMNLLLNVKYILL